MLKIRIFCCNTLFLLNYLQVRENFNHFLQALNYRNYLWSMHSGACGCDWWWKLVQCCKERYYIWTWNVRSMNQGKLEMIKQEVVIVNINILGISELKCTAVCEFKSDDHYIYYYGQESLRRHGVAIIVNKRAKNAVLGFSLKNYRIISVHFQGKPLSITVIQACAPISNNEEAEVERFY